MQTPSDDKRLRRLEFKMNLMLGFCVVQLLLVGMMVTAMAISKVTYYLVFITLLVLLAAGVYVFRQQIPSWFGQLSRMVFANLLSSKSDAENESQ